MPRRPGGRFDRRPEGDEGVVESRSRGAGWNSQPIGDLSWLELEVEVERQDDPMIDGQGGKAALDDLPIRNRADQRCVVNDWQNANAGRPPLAPTGLVVAGTHEQLLEPGSEAFRLAQVAQVAPCADEGLLDGILGELGIPEHRPGRAVEAVDLRADEQLEGAGVALAGSVDELLLGHPAASIRRHGAQAL